MNLEFKRCLANKKIRKFSGGRSLVNKELSLAAADLKEAEITFKKIKNYKWTVIQAYYAMFHAARGLLYAQGYKERSHYCLIASIREFYVDQGLLSYRLLEAFQLGKTLRENADYYGNFSKVGAETMLDNAAEFIKMSKKIIVTKRDSS